MNKFLPNELVLVKSIGELARIKCIHCNWQGEQNYTYNYELYFLDHWKDYKLYKEDDLASKKHLKSYL